MDRRDERAPHRSAFDPGPRTRRRQRCGQPRIALARDRERYLADIASCKRELEDGEEL